MKKNRKHALPPARLAFIDSGLGGLSVWRAWVKRAPAHATLYLADQAHVPYGPRPLDEVRGFAMAMVQALVDSGIELVVLASNTTSAAALYPLRERFSGLPIVGMEPAIKPAIAKTHSGVVGVLATPGTFNGQPFARLMERFSQGARVLTQPCPGWVEAVEAGVIDGAHTRQLVADRVLPLLEAGADQLVLGCTHYPFLRPVIESVVQGRAEIIDPAMAVAEQALRVFHGGDSLSSTATHEFISTVSLAGLSEKLCNLKLHGQFDRLVQARWERGRLLF